MDIERKKELLHLAEYISMDISEQDCGNYMPKVINSIKIAQNYGDKEKFITALEKFKTSTFGGNSEKEGYSHFVDYILKKKEYKLKELTLQEMELVFSWVRRIVRSNTGARNENTTNSGNNGSHKSKSYNNGSNNNETVNNTTKSKGTKGKKPIKKNNNKNGNNKDNYDNPFDILKNLKF